MAGQSPRPDIPEAGPYADFHHAACSVPAIPDPRSAVRRQTPYLDSHSYRRQSGVGLLYSLLPSIRGCQLPTEHYAEYNTLGYISGIVIVIANEFVNN